MRRQESRQRRFFFLLDLNLGGWGVGSLLIYNRVSDSGFELEIATRRTSSGQGQQTTLVANQRMPALPPVCLERAFVSGTKRKRVRERMTRQEWMNVSGTGCVSSTRWRRRRRRTLRRGGRSSVGAFALCVFSLSLSPSLFFALCSRSSCFFLRVLQIDRSIFRRQNSLTLITS